MLVLYPHDTSVKQVFPPDELSLSCYGFCPEFAQIFMKLGNLSQGDIWKVKLSAYQWAESYDFRHINIIQGFD